MKHQIKRNTLINWNNQMEGNNSVNGNTHFKENAWSKKQHPFLNIQRYFQNDNMQIRLMYAKKAQASTGLKCDGHKAVTEFFAKVL